MWKGTLKSFVIERKIQDFSFWIPCFFCLDKIRNILENIGKCNEAIKSDVEISNP